MAKQQLDPISPGENLLEEFVRPLGLRINALARAITAVRRGLRMITL